MRFVSWSAVWVSMALAVPTLECPPEVWTGRFTARPAASVLFTPMNERSAAFAPDGRMVLFTVRLEDGYRQEIFISRRRGAGWTTPVVAPFSGKFFDADPSFSPDGRSVLFATNRSIFETEKPDLDLWRVTLDGDRWGVPQPVPGVNSAASDSSPVLTRSGRLYFASSRSGAGDIYVSEPTKDGFSEPKSVGEGVNSDAPEVSVAVSPDEKTLVFCSIGRSDEALAPGHLYVRGDLYVSRWDGHAWAQARRLPAPINSPATEGGPMFSGDGKSFYFMSERGFATDQNIYLTPRALEHGLRQALNGRGNIYVIDARALETAP